MAFLVLFFIVALSLCVVGLIVIALAAIWESVREENCKNSNEKRALKTIDWTAWSEASARSTWRSCRSCYASPDSIMRYFRSRVLRRCSCCDCPYHQHNETARSDVFQRGHGTVPAVPSLAIVPVSRYLCNGSLDEYRLDFCRHSYLSSRRMWRIGEH